MFEVSYFDRKAYLAQSPQLYKQMAAISLERVFSTSTVWRAEKHDTSKHINEIRQMDIEVAFADDKIILTATVNELTNGKTATLYDSVANKEFGKKILSIVRSNDFGQATSMLKGAQMPAAAPAPVAPVPAESLEAGPKAMPSAPEMEEPRDAGGTGDPKEELPKLLDSAENTLADIRSAVEALLEESETGLEGFDELSEEMGTEAATVVGLNKLSKKVGKAMLVGMKSAHHELSEQISELKMAKHVVDNRGKVRKDQVAYIDGLVADAMADTKKVLATCYGLMGTFVKYADGTKDVEMRAKLAQSKPPAKPSGPHVETKPQDDLKKDPQLQRALDLLKAMRILDRTRPTPAGTQAQVR